MKLNLKITFLIFLAFSFSFSTLYLVNDWYRLQTDPIKNEFNLKLQDPDYKSVFVFGSSHVNVLNKNFVYNYVETNGDGKYIVHFATKGNDSPLKRLEDLDRIQSYNPSLVVYGINLRDFKEVTAPTTPIIQQISKPKSFLPDPENLIDKHLSLDNLFWIDFQNFANPKLTTLSLIKEKIEIPIEDLLKELIPLEEKKRLEIEQAELEEIAKQKRAETIAHHYNILSIEELQEHAVWLTKDPINVREDNHSTLAFIEVIRLLKENNVKIIIFTTPIHKFAWDRFSESDKEAFFAILDKISKDYDVEVHYFHDKYSDMNIWTDSQHITIDPKGIIYSQNISELILNSTR